MDLCNRHFMKRMNGVFTHSITLPDQITPQFLDLTNKLLALKRPNGASWHVGLIKSGETLILKPGWNDFIAGNNIQENDTVVFKYLGGSEFETLIFDLNGCEKSVLTSDLEISQPLTPPVNVMPLNICTSNLDLVDLGKTKARNNNTDSYYKPNCLVMNEDQKRKADILASQVQDGNPSFLQVLKPTHLDRFGIKVPKKFAVNHLPKESGEFIFCLYETEKRWRIKYTYRTYRQEIYWMVFVRENKLREGDMCLFELVRNAKDVTFVVHVSRAL
ncbi:hypothetical protein LUZ60_004983 [Juncus effusus]|nr:hypothetical protein LUZ60_004983 [Juncus effusus]